MTESFLTYVAAHIAQQHPQNVEDVCVVFSNRRAKLFFTRELNKLNPQTQWLPTIMAMEDFVQELTGTRFSDPLSILFEFYEVYKECEKENAEPFEQFNSWATQLLHDFEETDLYLVDNELLFKHVDHAYAIKNWSPDGKSLTRNQEQYLHFWSRMGIWYKALQERLSKKNRLSQAMAFRRLANQMDEIAGNLPWKHVVFAGFNALNQAEQKFIRSLEKRKVASILWDADSYYIDNELNEAGYFMRKFKSKHGISVLKRTGDNFVQTPKNIRITGVAKNTGQAVWAGSILKTLLAEGANLNETALVLCDEQLLMPVLESLPEEIHKVNVTMGYPLHLLPETGFIQTLFDLQNHTRKSKNQLSWYNKDLLRLFQHPLVHFLLPETFLTRCQRKVKESRYVFLPLNKLIQLSGANEDEQKVLELILVSWNDSPAQALQHISHLIHRIGDASIKASNAPAIVMEESLFHLTGLLNRLQTYSTEYSGLESVQTLHRLFEQLCRQTTLPFYGEPLDGLQIMGLLETRNLDFKNLILLSVNEGILPKGRSQNSFIPLDISSAYGLPGYRERDAVFAWHFYRLLQRAENVWLTYNTEPDEFAKGEKSRFIAQLEEELTSPNITLESNILVNEVNIPDEPVFHIRKTPDILERIVSRYGSRPERSLTPTTLNQYLSCSLQFFFRNICNIREEDKHEDEIDHSLLGTIVHKVLQDFFEPLKGQKLMVEHYEQMLLQLPESIRAAFVAEMDEEDINQGKNLLTFKGAQQMVANYLNAELRMLKSGNHDLVILELEHSLEPLSVSLSGSRSLYLGGKADRIDILDGVLRVIDYKTGTVKDKELEIETLNDILERDDMGKALQLLLYSHLASRMYPNYPVIAGIVSLRAPSKGLIEFQTSGLSQDYVQQFFQSLVGQIVDTKLFFSKTDNLKACEYCTFKAICNR